MRGRVTAATTELYQWFTGGADFAYSTLLICMGGDATWARLLVASKILIFLSYLLVARYLLGRWVVIRRLKFARFLLWGALVFLNCGAVHLLNGVEYFWPARRLEALLSFTVAGINILYVLGLHKVSAVENVLKLNVARPDNGGRRNVEA